MLQTRNWGTSDGDEWQGDAGQLVKQPGGGLEEMKVLEVRSSRLEKEEMKVDRRLRGLRRRCSNT